MALAAVYCIASVASAQGDCIADVTVLPPLQEGESRLVANGVYCINITPSVEPDSSMLSGIALIYKSRDGRLYSLDSGTRVPRLLRTPKPMAGIVGVPAWSPTGSTYYEWIDTVDQLVAWNVDEVSGRRLPYSARVVSGYKCDFVVPRQWYRARRVSVDYDGSLITIIQELGAEAMPFSNKSNASLDDRYSFVRLVDNDAPKILTASRYKNGLVSSWDYEPGKRQLVISCIDQGRRVVRVEALDGTIVAELDVAGSGARYVDFSLDGRYLLCEALPADPAKEYDQSLAFLGQLLQQRRRLPQLAVLLVTRGRDRRPSSVRPCRRTTSARRGRPGKP